MVTVVMSSALRIATSVSRGRLRSSVPPLCTAVRCSRGLHSYQPPSRGGSHRGLNLSNACNRSRALHLYSTSEDSPRQGAGFEELSVQELSQMLGASTSEDVQFVDVREHWEVDVAKLPMFKTVPLGKLLGGEEEVLETDRPTVLLCHHGRRSQAAAFYLSQRGFERLYNVTGGIDAYSRDVDPSIPTY